MRIYLDVCCLDRQFDDQSQERVFLEAEAIGIVYEAFERGDHIWIASEVVSDEISETSDSGRRDGMAEMLTDADEFISTSDELQQMAEKFRAQGIRAKDALHLSAASAGGTEVFLTTDDLLIRRAKKLDPPLGFIVINPLNWLAKGMKE